MVDKVEITEIIVDVVVLAAIFFILMAVGMYVQKRVNNSSNRYFNPREFLPDDEIHTLKQVFYLIMMALCFVNVFYGLIFQDADLMYFAIFDIVLSIFIAVTLDKSSNAHKILILLLIPFASMDFLLFDNLNLMIFGIIHIIAFLYMIKIYYDKFMEYTSSNGLGLSIILLFTIIFISFFITQLVEGVNPLDSLVMVSNAFTSNGYAVLGSSIPGKINSLFLVWGGYIISGVATSTLTATILLKHFNKRIRKLEALIDEEGE